MKLSALLNEDSTEGLGLWMFKSLVLSNAVPNNTDSDPHSRYLASKALKAWMDETGKTVDEAFKKFKAVKIGKESSLVKQIAAVFGHRQEQTISALYHVADDIRKLNAGAKTNFSVDIYYYDGFETPPAKLNDCKSLSLYGFKGVKEIPSWFPANVGNLAFYKCGEVNFKNVDKVLKSCKKLIMGTHSKNLHFEGEDSYLGKNVLGWVSVQEFEGFTQFSETTQKDIEIMWILNDYLGGDKLECQDALIDAGLDEYAKP